MSNSINESTWIKDTGRQPRITFGFSLLQFFILKTAVVEALCMYAMASSQEMRPPILLVVVISFFVCVCRVFAHALSEGPYGSC